MLPFALYHGNGDRAGIAGIGELVGGSGFLNTVRGVRQVGSHQRIVNDLEAQLVDFQAGRAARRVAWLAAPGRSMSYN